MRSKTHKNTKHTHKNTVVSVEYASLTTIKEE